MVIYKETQRRRKKYTDKLKPSDVEWPQVTLHSHQISQKSKRFLKSPDEERDTGTIKG